MNGWSDGGKTGNHGKSWHVLDVLDVLDGCWMDVGCWVWQGTLTYYHGSELYIEWVRDLSHSKHIFPCVTVSQNVTECPGMPRNVTECHGMSRTYWTLSQDGATIFVYVSEYVSTDSIHDILQCHKL